LRNAGVSPALGFRVGQGVLAVIPSGVEGSLFVLALEFVSNDSAKDGQAGTLVLRKLAYRLAQKVWRLEIFKMRAISALQFFYFHFCGD
jgi:hypothetical protein